MSKVAHTAQTLAALSLKELAALINVPSLVKMSKAKAIARVLAVLPAAKPAKVKKTDDAPRVSKHALLTEALSAPATREDLMEASGFDNKNLSVAMCNLKRAGYVIKIAVTGDVRTYVLA